MCIVYCIQQQANIVAIHSTIHTHKSHVGSIASHLSMSIYEYRLWERRVWEHKIGLGGEEVAYVKLINSAKETVLHHSDLMALSRCQHQIPAIRTPHPVLSQHYSTRAVFHHIPSPFGA